MQRLRFVAYTHCILDNIFSSKQAERLQILRLSERNIRLWVGRPPVGAKYDDADKNRLRKKKHFNVTFSSLFTADTIIIADL
jgi:hypothetical protein